MITVSPACLAAFSQAIAFLYEAGLDTGRLPEALSAIKDFLEADDVLITSAPGGRQDASSVSGKRTLCLDIVHGGTSAQLVARRAVPFGEDHVMRLALLRPHLEHASGISKLLRHGRFGLMAGNALLSQIHKGLIVTDPTGHILWRNPAADGILQSADGLIAAEGKIKTMRAFETAQLHDRIAEAQKGRPGAMLVARQSGHQAYGINIVPLDAPQVLIAVKAIEREIEVLTGKLGTLFGLTPAEERLAILLLQGHTLQSAAETAQKSLATVKSQLHSILKKTGSRGQADLMHILLALPSLV